MNSEQLIWCKIYDRMLRNICILMRRVESLRHVKYFICNLLSRGFALLKLSCSMFSKCSYHRLLPIFFIFCMLSDLSSIYICKNSPNASWCLELFLNFDFVVGLVMWVRGQQPSFNHSAESWLSTVRTFDLEIHHWFILHGVSCSGKFKLIPEQYKPWASIPHDSSSHREHNEKKEELSEISM